MRIHEQAAEAKKTLRQIEEELRDMTARIHRKMSVPYGDGTYSNMVNATSDVLPLLASMRGMVSDALERVEG
jgi:hypothetical protein